MNQKLLETRKVDGKTLLVDFKVMEREYPIGGTVLKTFHYLSLFQWQLIDLAVLNFARKHPLQEPTDTQKVFLEDNILLNIQMKETDMTYFTIMNLIPEETHSCRMEVKIELIDQDFFNKVESAGNECVMEFEKKLQTTKRQKPYITGPLSSMNQLNSQESISSNDVVQLEEKYAKISPTKGKKNPAPKQTKLLSDWMKPHSKKKKDFEEEKYDEAERIRKLKEREEKVRQKDKAVQELNERLLPKYIKAISTVEPHVQENLMLTSYTTKALAELYETLFKDKAQKHFDDRSKKYRMSKYVMSHTDFTPTTLIDEMMELFQTEFGNDNDMGKYTELFTSVMVPEFAYELFKHVFEMNDEQAGRQIEWQGHENARLQNDKMDAGISFLI